MIIVLALPAFKNKNSNPYNYLLYSSVMDKDVKIVEFSFIKAFKLNYDIIHIHWPEVYLNSNYIIKALLFSSLLLASLSFARILGKKVVWTVHNFEPHENKYKTLSLIFWHIFNKRINGIISLSNANKKTILNKNPELTKKEQAVIYHGLYRNYYKNNTDKYSSKKVLSIDENKTVILFLGQIRKYKNIEELIKIFNTSKKLKGTILLIAGKFENEEYYKSIKKSISTKNIILLNKFIEDNELQFYYNAADLTVLPFKNIFNSGSALLSISFNTPVLVPYSDNFLEYSKLTNNSIKYYKENLTEEIIADSISNNWNNIDYNKLEWNYISEQTKIFYKKVLGL